MSYYIDVQANVADPLGNHVTALAVAFQTQVTEDADVISFVSQDKPGGVVQLVDPHTADPNIPADDAKHFVRGYLTKVFTDETDASAGTAPVSGGTYHTYIVTTNDAPFTKVFKVSV